MRTGSRVVAPSTASGYAIVEPRSLGDDLRAIVRLHLAARRQRVDLPAGDDEGESGFEAPLGSAFVPGSNSSRVLVLGPDGSQAEMPGSTLLRAGVAFLIDEIRTFHLPRSLRSAPGRRALELGRREPVCVLWSRRFVHFLDATGHEATIPAYDFMAFLVRFLATRTQPAAARVITPLA